VSSQEAYFNQQLIQLEEKIDSFVLETSQRLAKLERDVAEIIKGNKQAVDIVQKTRNIESEIRTIQGTLGGIVPSISQLTKSVSQINKGNK
jgi:uncharacterized protein YoxC